MISTFLQGRSYFCSFSSWISSLPPPNLKRQVTFLDFFYRENDKRNFIAPVQSEPIEDIEIIPESEVPKGSPPVDLSAEFAELNQESGNVMAEGKLSYLCCRLFFAQWQSVILYICS